MTMKYVATPKPIHRDDCNYARDGPFPLHTPEMIDVLPALVAPKPMRCP